MARKWYLAHALEVSPAPKETAFTCPRARRANRCQFYLNGPYRHVAWNLLWGEPNVLFPVALFCERLAQLNFVHVVYNDGVMLDALADCLPPLQQNGSPFVLP